MAALRRERLPAARYGLFWAVFGPFRPVFSEPPAASVSKTLAKQAEALLLPYWWTTEHRLQLSGHIYKLPMQ